MELFMLTVIVTAACIKNAAFGQISCGGWTRFECQDGACLSKAKVCNGMRDCLHGEDEENCGPYETEIYECHRRNLSMALLNGYTCKKTCSRDEECRSRNKKCICDDECGMSCANPWSTCPSEPPEVEHSVEYEVQQRDRSTAVGVFYIGASIRYKCPPGMRAKGPQPRCTGKRVWSSEVPRCVDVVCRNEVPHILNSSDYHVLRPRGREFFAIGEDEDPLVGDVIEYICDNGLLRVGNPPRCDDNRQWTPHSIRCVVPCFEKRDAKLISELHLTCGKDCDTSADCNARERCHCDGPCGRVCVDPNIQCGIAPPVPHAILNYTGEGINKVARYSCEKGFYLQSGSLSMRCCGSGLWLGKQPRCAAVICGDPGFSIRQTGGEIFSYQGLHVGAVMEFMCRSNYKMLGSRIRTCMADGTWSGQLTVCDRRDDLPRCPHPGFPINGMMRQTSGKNFAFNSTIRFWCDRGYILVGDEEQTCLYFKQWSGHITPLCIDPKYPHRARDVIATLSRSLSNFPDKRTSLGRSLLANERDRPHEIYFMFDVSDSVLRRPLDLKDEIEFAKRFVRRMEGFEGKIKYGITVFASENVTALDISKTDTPSTEELIKLLDRVYNEAANKTFEEKTRRGTATGYALRQLKKTIAAQRQKLERDNRKDLTKRHVFIFTDGKHTEGENPIEIRKSIEAQFLPNIEFYSVTACNKCHEEDHSELYGLASIDPKTHKKNYIFIEDFYLLSEYLDRVTDIEIDFSKCGQAGDVRSIKKQASLQRSAGGKDAAENAWPWQVLITEIPTSDESSIFEDRFVLGGGSILSRRWVLSAAHLFKCKSTAHIALTAGIFERPHRGQSVTKSVQIFHAEHIYCHPEYSHPNPYSNDIALIKTGARVDPYNMKIDESHSGGFEYSYYVRPVCLPCTGTCFMKKVIGRGNDSVVDGMSAEKTCDVEEEKLIVDRAKTVVTGFGHTTTSHVGDYEAIPARHLQQTLLRVSSKYTCSNGIRALNEKVGLTGNEKYPYTENMFCSETLDSDACKGDSGGPLVREVIDDETRESCWVQIGIVSFGYGCKSGDIPAYHTNVLKYISWMRNKTGKEVVPNY